MAERSIELTSEATRDIEAAVDWYDARAPRLGDEFLKRLDIILGNIQSQPLMYPELESNVRRGLLKQFPFAVYYVPREATVRVFAVLHTSAQITGRTETNSAPVMIRDTS